MDYSDLDGQTPNSNPLKDGDKCIVILIMKFNYGITNMQMLKLFKKLFQRLSDLRFSLIEKKMKNALENAV